MKAKEKQRKKKTGIETKRMQVIMVNFIKGDRESPTCPLGIQKKLWRPNFLNYKMQGLLAEMNKVQHEAEKVDSGDNANFTVTAPMDNISPL